MRMLYPAGRRHQSQSLRHRAEGRELIVLAAWLVPLRRFWLSYMDALERHLDRAEQSAAAKTTKRIPRSPDCERNQGEAK